MGRSWRPARWQHLRPLPSPAPACDDLTAAACGAEAGLRNLVCAQALQEQPKKAWVHTRSGSSSSLPVTVRASSPTWEEWYKWFAPSKLRDLSSKRGSDARSARTLQQAPPAKPDGRTCTSATAHGWKDVIMLFGHNWWIRLTVAVTGHDRQMWPQKRFWQIPSYPRN